MKKQAEFEYEYDYPFDLEIGEIKLIPKVSYDTNIEINNKFYDFNLLYYITNEVDFDDYYCEYTVEDDEIGKLLLDLNVLSSLGDEYHRAEVGPNFDKFAKLIFEECDRVTEKAKLLYEK